LGKICVEKILIVAARNKTNLLRIRLLGQSQAMLPSELAHVGLIHSAQREESSAELLLCQTKKEIGLVLGTIRGTLQQPPPARVIKFHTRIMASGDRVCPNLPRDGEQLIELQMIVAKAARNWSAAGEILLHKRPHHIALKAVLMIDHVIRNANRLSHPTRVVNVVERAASSSHRLRHARA